MVLFINAVKNNIIHSVFSSNSWVLLIIRVSLHLIFYGLSYWLFLYFLFIFYIILINRENFILIYKAFLLVIIDAFPLDFPALIKGLKPRYLAINNGVIHEIQAKEIVIYSILA